jgi:hypothetical protein
MLILATLLMSATAYAQGNDFPFSPDVPAWGQPVIPSPVPPFDFNPGADVPNSWVQAQNRKGDTVVLRVVLDEWELGPLSLSIMASAPPAGLWWDGPDTPPGRWWHPGLGYWCLQCTWKAVAGDDNAGFWLTFVGSERFRAHLEVVDVIPAPRSLFSVLSDPDKQTSEGIATGLTAASGVFAGSAIGFSADLPLSGIFWALSYAGGLFSAHFHEVARDPWDGDYCSATYPAIDPQTNANIAWASQVDPSGWLVPSIEQIDAYMSQAIVAANRALSADQAGVADCAWTRRYEARQALRQAGDWMWYFRWALQVTADTYAPIYGDIGLYGQLDGVAYIAEWLEGLQ